MKIIAIDQSFRSTGICVFINGKLMHAEKYVSDESKDKFNRAWEIATYIRKITKTFDCDIVALEGLAFSSKGNATRDLAGLQFTIVTLLKFVEKLDVEIVAPNTVKKFATGKGNCKKTLMMDFLPPDVKLFFTDTLNLKKTTGLGDLTDAYFIGKTVEHLRK